MSSNEFMVTKEQIDEIFDKQGHEHQVDVAIALYKFVFDGSSPGRPAYDDIEVLDGWPTAGKEAGTYIATKFVEFDQEHHAGECLAGGLWMNKGFSSLDNKNMPGWAIDPDTATPIMKTAIMKGEQNGRSFENRD